MRKNKKKVVLEDIELKPQIIGYTYQKKSNFGRVLVLFIVFLLVVFYINDISVFINNLLGKDTAPSINNNQEGNNKDNDKNDIKNEIVYNVYSKELVINESNLTITSFDFVNKNLSFVVENKSGSPVDLSNKKYFLEFYTEDKTLLERHKIDFKAMANSAKINYDFTINNNFHFIVLEEKKTEDYPNVALEYDNYGFANITCIKDNETIVYKFGKDELLEISDTIVNSNINEENYYEKYTKMQTKATSYNNLDGVTATFNSTLTNGYTAVFALDLVKVNLSNLDEPYYYSYKTIPKVVKFEMQTYGFDCN